MVAQTKFEAGVFEPFQNPLQAYFSGLESLSQGFEPAMGPFRYLAKCQLEAAGLMSRRGLACLELPSSIAKCRTPEDYVREQMSFWQTAFEQYSESSRRIMDAWGQLAAMQPGFGTAARNGKRERDYITFPATTEPTRPAETVNLREARRKVA